MTQKAQMKSIALFYFFAFLDEELAKSATVKTFLSLKKQMKSKKISESDLSAAIVSETHVYWMKKRKRESKNRPAVNYHNDWLLPRNISLGPWQEFKKEVDDDDFLAVLWSKVLKLTDQDIASGLGVSAGTVRYRVGRGLRKLGALMSRPGQEVRINE